jgi:hypothetical protein
LTGKRAAFHALVAPRGHEGAKVHGPEGFEIAKVRCGTQVAFQKPGELCDVAQVCSQCMRADLTLDAQVIGPAPNGAGGIRGCMELVECGFGHARQFRPGMVREGFPDPRIKSGDDSEAKESSDRSWPSRR